MSALIQMGIPIRSEAGVGYQLKEGYFLPPLLFEKEEAIAAGFALKLLTTYMNDSSRESSLNALRKIESVLPKKVRTDYQRELEVLDFVPKSLEITFSNEHFRLLMTAIKNRYRVDLEYHTFRKEIPETRQIEPMRLFFAPGHTSNDKEYLKMICPEYRGEAYYQDAVVVNHKRLITASGIAPVEFSREVIRNLEVFSDETLNNWYGLYDKKEAKYFFGLMKSLEQRLNSVA